MRALIRLTRAWALARFAWASVTSGARLVAPPGQAVAVEDRQDVALFHALSDLDPDLADPPPRVGGDDPPLARDQAADHGDRAAQGLAA